MTTYDLGGRTKRTTKQISIETLGNNKVRTKRASIVCSRLKPLIVGDPTIGIFAAVTFYHVYPAIACKDKFLRLPVVTEPGGSTKRLIRRSRAGMLKWRSL